MATQLFGSNAAWLILGFIATQTYTYSTCSSNDHPVFKTLVYSIIFIVITETAVEGFVAYGYLVEGWGDPLRLTKPSLALAVLTDLQPLFDAIPAIFVQFYFTWRIWTFCMAACRRTIKKLVAVICLFIILTSICAFTSAIILTVIFLKTIYDPAGATRTQAAILIWTISTVVADVTITACMMSILYHAKSSSCFGETRDRLSRLLRLTIQTGFLTSVLAIPVAPLFAREHSGIYGLTCYLLGKSYVISLLANLNARSYRPGPPVMKAHLSTMSFIQPRKSAHGESSEVTDTTIGSGVISCIRSVVHAVRKDLTKPPNEETSCSDSEVGRETQLEGPAGISKL